MENVEVDLADRVEALLGAVDPHAVDQATFRGAQFDAGLAWVHFPEGKGGLGLSRGHQRLVDEALAAAGVRYSNFVVNPIGIGIGAPTILAHGTDAMHRRYLRPIFTGEELWCQLFSEPSHGSDLAGLATRAVRDGDEWVVNGQKVWTSMGHLARFGLLLVRTNPDAPKHKGLSYFVVDMTSPGIDVRPLYQMTGVAEFNEVFLSDVRVPHGAMLGAEGAGWAVATTSLMNERVALGGNPSKRGPGGIERLLEIWRRRSAVIDDASRTVYRERIVRLWMRSEVQRLTSRRAAGATRSGTPGPEGSIGKLFSAVLAQDLNETCIDLLGPEGMLHVPGYPMTQGVEDEARRAAHSERFLRSRATTIEGGTSEVMRNILAERVLGLPGDPRTDKDVPWSQIPS